jgi:hypothetical protein
VRSHEPPCTLARTFVDAACATACGDGRAARGSVLLLVNYGIPQAATARLG